MAVDAIISGDAAALKKLLRTDPELVRARSTREHRSTLLHYASANGVEDFRQKTPKNIVEITKMLLDAGAKVDAESRAYGGGSTTLGLAATSIHPERAGVQIALLQTLLAHGARMDRRSAGNGHSLIHGCLANGQPKAAEFFADLGAPFSLEEAAGLNRLTVVKSYFDENGQIRPPANRRQMESAFEFACWYGAKEVVEFLLDAGINPSWHDASGRTGLHCAAYAGQVNVIRLLLHRGARLDAKENTYNSTPLDGALWAWSRTRRKTIRERCYQVIALLSRAGAKLKKQPDKKTISDPKMQAALRGRYFFDA